MKYMLLIHHGTTPLPGSPEWDELDAQVALTLHTLGGLGTGEIARAFLVAEPAMGQRRLADLME